MIECRREMEQAPGAKARSRYLARAIVAREIKIVESRARAAREPAGVKVAEIAKVRERVRAAKIAKARARVRAEDESQVRAAANRAEYDNEKSIDRVCSMGRLH